jgi:hypothetical protein
MINALPSSNQSNAGSGGSPMPPTETPVSGITPPPPMMAGILLPLQRQFQLMRFLLLLNHMYLLLDTLIHFQKKFMVNRLLLLLIPLQALFLRHQSAISQIKALIVHLLLIRKNLIQKP